MNGLSYLICRALFHAFLNPFLIRMFAREYKLEEDGVFETAVVEVWRQAALLGLGTLRSR